MTPPLTFTSRDARTLFLIDLATLICAVALIAFMAGMAWGGGL
jgi:hypothetical protein